MYRARLILTLAMAAAGCASSPPDKTEAQAAAETKATLEAATRVGTAVPVVVERLRSLGFTVSSETGATTDERGPVGHVLAVRRDDGLLVHRSWSVSLDARADVVTASDVETGLTGL